MFVFLSESLVHTTGCTCSIRSTKDEEHHTTDLKIIMLRHQRTHEREREREVGEREKERDIKIESKREREGEKDRGGGEGEKERET